MKARSNNRDGAALRFVAEQLAKRTEEVTLHRRRQRCGCHLRAFALGDAAGAVDDQEGSHESSRQVKPGTARDGHLLEPIAAYWYAKKSGNAVADDTNLYQHALFPYALANIDRRYTRADDGEPGVLECKSCTYHKATDWADGAIPVYYELQLRYYLAVLDVEHGAFACIWGNDPESDLAMPEIIRDRAKEEIIFERLDHWIWSIEHDQPPTMEDVKPALALESLARIYGASRPGLPTIEFPPKYERQLRQIALLQGKIADCQAEIKEYEKEVEAHSVRIAEIMREHEHGVLNTSSDKLLIDFVTKTTRRPDSKALKEKYPAAYADVLKTSESRKLKVRIEKG